MSREPPPDPAEALPRQPGVALWREIAERLRGEIAAGTPAAGARLPSEAELARRFSVNRHTLRRALEELAQGGLIRIAQGRGSFVSEDVLDYAVGPRTRFSEWIRRHNKEPSGQVLRLAEGPAEPPVARGLGIATGAAVILLERLGFADDRPVSLAAHHFPATLGPGLLDALRTAPSITEALAATGVADYRRAVTRVTARLPTPEEAVLLRTPRSRPLLVTENVNVDAAGRVVEFGIARYPTPRVQIVFEP
ncbi:MAG: phosphonate metabolism transcriptional regulator PhnF [Proteobacteria bacterium]|nr:phosphonate metabolism transcriptional regulator PhnF [Pseudomonadota bacterium]